MNLAKAPIKDIADKVFSGRLEIGEIPSSRRNQVKQAVERLKAKAAEVEQITEDLTKLTVGQLKTRAKEKGISYSGLKKAELIAALESS